MAPIVVLPAKTVADSDPAAGIHNAFEYDRVAEGWIGNAPYRIQGRAWA